MGTKEKIQELSKLYEQYVVDCRRKIHRFAELGGQEVKTSAFIAQEAAGLNLEVEKVSTTGLLVTLDTGRPGNGVALRADIDALPMSESPCNMKQERAVVSEQESTCHACGHDAHAAVLLGAMHVLYDMRESLSGRIYFCFEEGEEIGTGWDGMLNALKRREINTVFALHTSSAVEHGRIAIVEGPCMGGTLSVDATFIGRGGHGSRPDLSANPVFAAAAGLCNLSVAFVNQIDAGETVTLGITSIQGGGVANIIPDTAQIIGTMRYFNEEEGKKALRIFKKVMRNTAEMNGCTISIHPKMELLLPPTVNDSDATKLARLSFEQYLPEGSIVDSEKWYGSETYAHYARRYKSFYGFLGTKNEELGTTAEHHNEHFDIDESALLNGIIAYVAYTLSALEDETVAGWGYTEVEALELVEEDEEEIVSAEQKEEPAALAGSALYNLDTKIGVLLQSEAAKEAIESVVNGVLNHPQIGFVKGISIRKTAEFMPDLLNEEILGKIEEALAKVQE